MTNQPDWTRLVLEARDAAPLERARAFGSLVERFQDFAYAVAIGVVGDPALAEDAAQEGLLAAFRALVTLREPLAFPSWLRRIVGREAARLRRPPMDELLDAAHDPVEAEVARRERATLVRGAVAALPESAREVLSLFYLAELSHKEIAALVEVPASTVKKRLHDARKKLRPDLATIFEEELLQARPSRDPKFADALTRLLDATLRGDRAEVAALSQKNEGIVRRAGPHPIWGGEPQALHVAAERGHLDVVEELLAQGAPIDGDNDAYGGWSPLLLAVHHGRSSVAELLLSRGAEVDIFAASLLGDVEKVRALLTDASPNAAGPNTSGPNASGPLHFAGTPEVVRALTSAGAALDSVDSWGCDPVACALGRESLDVARALIDEGAQPTAGVLAALGDVDALAKTLLKDPGTLEEVSRLDFTGSGTPLHAASARGQLAAVNLLLDEGAEPNARASGGQTPLHFAAWGGHVDVVRALLDAQADPSLLDDEQSATPLQWARFRKQTLGKEGLEPVIEALS